MTSKTDFFPIEEFPNEVSFMYPEHFVKLNAYRQQLTIDNINRGREVGEMIPQRLITERMAQEFGITAEQVWDFAIIGNWIAYDRELNAMTEQEREDHYAVMEEPISEELREEIEKDFLPNLEKMFEMVKENSLLRQLETEVLNDLLNENKES
jgi:hypothetical protein